MAKGHELVLSFPIRWIFLCLLLLSPILWLSRDLTVIDSNQSYFSLPTSFTSSNGPPHNGSWLCPGPSVTCFTSKSVSPLPWNKVKDNKTRQKKRGRKYRNTDRYRPLILTPEEETKQLAIDSRLLGSARSQIIQPAHFEKDNNQRKIRKIAFLFLTKGLLPLDLLWQKFFKGHEGEYEVFIHSSNSSIRFNESTTQFLGFYGREIPSIEIRWGSITMVTATRRLLASAILDPTVHRFVLLSEACIPIHNFSYIRDYLFSVEKSHIASHPAKRFWKVLREGINSSHWRKGSQWFVLTRRHASQVVMDDIIYHTLKKNLFKISDEHYVQTLLAGLKEEPNIEPRSVTFTRFLRKNWHPSQYEEVNTSKALIKELHGIHRYDRLDRKVPEYERSHPCLNDGVEVPCYLFARKFMPSSLSKLMDMEHVLGY